MENSILVESCAIAVSRSVSNSDSINWDAAMRFCTDGEKDGDSEEYYKAAICIVEPLFRNEEAEEYYYDMMDNNSANWANWIGCMFEDSRWGELAKKVLIVGY